MLRKVPEEHRRYGLLYNVNLPQSHAFLRSCIGYEQVTIPHLCCTEKVCVSNTIIVHLELVHAIYIRYLESCFIFATLLSVQFCAYKRIDADKF